MRHGVFLKPLGDAVVTGSDWTACTTLDLASFKNLHASLSEQLTAVDAELRQVATRVTDNSKTSMMTTLQSAWGKLYRVIKTNLDLHGRIVAELGTSIMQPSPSKSAPKSKRGLVDAVGNIGHFLFGLSTEKDIQNVNKKIAGLGQATENITHVLHQQFSYIKEVSSQVLREGKQIERLDLSVSEMTAALRKIANDSSALQVALSFTELGLTVLSSLTMISDEISRSLNALNSLRNIVAEAEKGNLSWELLEGNTFRQLLTELQGHLPQGWSLLYDIHDHFSYLQFARVNSYPFTRGLHICVQIPIVETASRYHLYEAIPLPKVHPEFKDNLYFMYNFKHTFLAMQHQGTELLTLPLHSSHELFTMDAEEQQQCRGTDPRVCPLLQAVRSTSGMPVGSKNTGSFKSGSDRCLKELFLGDPASKACPAQVLYQEDPYFRNVGKGVWLYGAASGKLSVLCTNRATRPSDTREYELSGTGAFRLSPGCQATFGNIRIPSYTHGQGQFLSDIPTEPVEDLFSLDFAVSLWANISASLNKPTNMSLFLDHLQANTAISANALSLQQFNVSLQRFRELENQLPAYHPLRWIQHPEAQLTGFIVIIVVLVAVGVSLTMKIWQRRRNFGRRAAAQPTAPGMGLAGLAGEPGGVRRRLVRVRRPRRPTVVEESV